MKKHVILQEDIELSPAYCRMHVTRLRPEFRQQAQGQQVFSFDESRQVELLFDA